MPDERTTTDGPLREDVIHSPAHLDKIRELYTQGQPISLPAALDSERAELDTARAAFTKSQQGSTPASGAGSLRSSATTSAPSTPAGTAGSSTSAPK